MPTTWPAGWKQPTCRPWRCWATPLTAKVAVELAVRHPDHVGGLVLVGPTMDPAAHRVVGTLGHALRDPIEDKLPQVKVPVLVTWGSREPIAVGLGADRHPTPPPG